MNEIGQGLSLSAIGILITFSSLGILILLILILKALFPVKEDDLEASGLEATSPGGSTPDRDELRKKAAAAGVAVLLGTKSFSRIDGLGSELEKPVGNWWKRGLDQIHGKERL